MKSIITVALLVVAVIMATGGLKNWTKTKVEDSKAAPVATPSVSIMPFSIVDGHVDLHVYVGSNSYNISMEYGDTAVIKPGQKEVEFHPMPEAAKAK
jgi:hypothetical protein